MKICKSKLKTILAETFIAIFIFSSTVLATDENFKAKKSNEFKTWDNLPIEEKEEIIMPSTFDIEVPESILKKYNTDKVPSLISQLLGKTYTSFNNVSAAVTQPRYNIADNINLRVENQGSTTECWAFSILKSFETNIALNSGLTNIPDFSERHMDYATSKTFLDGINTEGFQREVGQGGLLPTGLAYLTNGQGAVLEQDMPFQNNEQKINKSEIDKQVDTIANDYSILPKINKTYTTDAKGNTLSVKYLKSDGTEYTTQELNATRNIIKQHLVEYGAIASMTGGNQVQYYNSNSIFSATNYNCNNNQKIRDHAITIVGWDDKYSRSNFKDGARPSTDGAYIVLNSYGVSSFDKGYMYISYEDYFIEQEIYGTQSTSKLNYDNLYQHDFYGGIISVGVDNKKEGFYGVTYDRDASKEETLESVGITLCDYSNLEIFVNPYDNTFDSEKLIKVASTNKVLDPGYHRIKINPIKLTGNNFAIAVKQKAENGNFYFQVETNIQGSVYSGVSSDNKSFMSLDGGTTWSNLSTLGIVDGINMSTSDVCIKAFTVDGDKVSQENEIETNKYQITDNCIMNVSFGTTISDFYENINTYFPKKILTDGDIEILDNSQVIRTGMKLKLSNGSVYTIIIRGDINKDGKVSLIDLSKLILHYNEFEGFELFDDSLKAADMNIDGRVSLIDLSQMILLYNSI